MASRLLPLLITLLALLPATALAAAPAPALVEGQDYVVIEGGTPFAPLNGKVEVVEVFGYTCVHCAHLEPTISQWKKKQPAYVRFTPVPAAFGGYWIPYARAFYAAQLLGVQDKTHAAVFDALHTTGSLPIQNASADEITAFYASHGVNAQRFGAALRGADVDARVERSRQWVKAAGVEGTPSIIVNGRYRVIGGRNYDDMLRIASQLVARERNARN